MKEQMKEQYQELEMETIVFESEDVITASGEPTGSEPIYPTYP